MIDIEELADRLEGTENVENCFACAFKIDFDSDNLVYKRNIKPIQVSVKSNNIGKDCWLNERIEIVMNGKPIKYLGRQKYPRDNSPSLYFFEREEEALLHYNQLIDKSLNQVEEYQKRLENNLDNLRNLKL
jgi:hypothetical protein